MKLLKTYPKLSLLIIASILPVFCAGQTNLVPNPSFEDTVSCPTADAQLYNCVGWDALGSPDYFNACSSSPDVSVPNNWGGYQQPSSGIAYVAVGTYGDTSFGYSCNDSSYCDSREYIGQLLSSPLTVGTKYYVTIKTSLSISNTIYCNCATNNIGLLFSMNQPGFAIPNPTLIRNFAHVVCPTLITDSSGWTTISGTFVADSAYQYITIGNFFDDPNTSTQIMDANTYCNAYYFIDDVCVSTDSAFAASYIYTGIQEVSLNENFNIYPNPVTDYFQINQAFTEPYDLIIYNALGQQLYQENNITTNNKTIDATAFIKGILLINIKSGNQSTNYKLLKQ